MLRGMSQEDPIPPPAGTPPASAPASSPAAAVPLPPETATPAAPPFPPGLIAPASVAFAVAVGASLLIPGFAGARWLRLAASAALAAILFTQRLRPRGTVRVIVWSLTVVGTAAAATHTVAPWGAPLLLGLLIGLAIRKSLAPWVSSWPAGPLLLLAVAALLPFAAAIAVPGSTPPASVLARLDRASYTLVAAWVLLAGLKAAREATRRWIRRASVRTKLVVSFGIFAVTPAVLAFAYVALSGWMHAGALRADALEQALGAMSRGRPLIEAAERGPAPKSGAELVTRLDADAPFLADGLIRADALERTPGGWRVLRSVGAPDSLFQPPAPPVADSGLIVRGLVLRADRIWWAETALWPRGRDSLALETFEPVDTTRMGTLARMLRCDAVLFASPSPSRPGTNVVVGWQGKSRVRGYELGNGIVQVTTDEDRGGAGSSDTAAVAPFLGGAPATVVGGGAFAGVTSLPQVRTILNSGAVPGCLAWAGSGWRRATAVLAVRSNPWESVAWSDFGSGPFSTVAVVLLILLATLFLMVEAVSVMVGSRVAGYITRGASGLRQAAAAIGRGDFTARVRVPSEDELGQLAGSFNRMAEGLEEGQRAVLERERMRRELELARRIQSRLLPAAPPPLPGLDVAATNAMSQEVGGDYYDFIPMAEGRVGFCVADVAGKGVGAALLMSNVKAALVSAAAVEPKPDRLVTRVNRLLEQSVEPGRFVTLFFGSLDPATRRLDYVNAGHPAPLLIRAGGGTERLSEGGTILGIDADAVYESGSTTLGAGDLLALFTDGVTEAQGEGGELFGEERIETLLRSERGRPAARVLEQLLAAVKAYEGDRGPSDDLTAVVLSVEGA